MFRILDTGDDFGRNGFLLWFELKWKRLGKPAYGSHPVLSLISLVFHDEIIPANRK
jgi:hypothetical protein